MKNKPIFFITGVSQTGGVGGSAAWEFFPHNPVFFLRTSLSILVTQRQMIENTVNKLFLDHTQYAEA